MTATAERGVRFDEFTIERELAAPPARVFRAFSDPEAKWAWFNGGPESEVVERSLDFRVGGVEIYEGRRSGAFAAFYSHRFVAAYHDIVAGERIIYSYEMYVDGVKLSVSQTTVQFAPVGDGTRLAFTEYGAFLDGAQDPAQRRQGTEELMDALAAALAGGAS